MLTLTVCIGSAFFLLQGYGASGIAVNVSLRNQIVRVGQNFTFLCRAGTPLLYCHITVPGYDTPFIINENVPKNSDNWYAGDGLNAGDCGITIARIDDKQNGQFKCTLAVPHEQGESFETTNVTVARTPAYDPVLVVTPDADRNYRAYNEGTIIQATCTVRDARPAADILWFIDYDQITDGLSHTDIQESSNYLFTVQQKLTRKLSWMDNGRNLKCVATHIALDDRPKQTNVQISVRFAPRPLSGQTEQFRFVVGKEGIISVQIHGNPQPMLSWTVDNENIPEGNMDTTRRFKADRIREMGHSTWETTLRILTVTAEDVERKFVLTARNDVGEEQHRVMIFTSTGPEAVDATRHNHNTIGPPYSTPTSQQTEWKSTVQLPAEKAPPELAAANSTKHQLSTGPVQLATGHIIGIAVAILVLLIVIFTVIVIFRLKFARATGQWCFSGAAATRHGNKESDIMAVKITTSNNGGPRDILGSADLQYDDVGVPPSKKSKKGKSKDLGWDLKAVKIETSNDGRPRETELGSAFNLYDYNKSPTPQELERLVMGSRA